MGLDKCIECGGAVSDAALACPHCKGDWHGQSCGACGIRMRLSDAVVQILDYSSFEGPFSKYLHEACLLVLLPDRQVPCQDCGTPIKVRAHGLAARGRSPNSSKNGP